MNKFLDEIFEQPAALKNTLDYYCKGEGAHLLEKVSRMWQKGNFSQVLFTGMGSSFFAPHSASCFLSDNGIRSFTHNAGELLHYHLQLLKEDVMLTCISQSGESFEVVKLMDKINPGVKFIGITNEENSTLARKAGIALLSRAGKELMTSTKTYVSTLLVLNIYCRVLAGKWAPAQKSVEELNAVVGASEFLIALNQDWLADAMKMLGYPPFVQVVGRGPAYSSVLQGALMFMEAVRNPASGLYGGEFRHGPMEMSKKGFRAIILAPIGVTYNQGIRLANDLAESGGKVILITNSQKAFSNKNIFSVRVPVQDEFLFPIAAIIPIQFIVNQWAADKGITPGQFSVGAKVTTTE